MIALGDGLQHAIMTLEEVNGAIGRLARSGYIESLAGGSFALTTAGRSLATNAMTASHWSARQERLERLLSAMPRKIGDDPRLAAHGEAAQIAEAEYAAAVARYTSKGVQ